MSDRICSVEDCGKPFRARGYCTKHYYRWNRHGDPLGGRTENGRYTVCQFDGCENLNSTRGYCKGHNRQLKNGESLRPLATRTKGGAKCPVEDCGKHTKSGGNGMCSKHYQRWKNHGDPMVVTQAPAGAGTTDKRGYRKITVDGQVVREHRYVMEQALGRPLFPDENVHHINGDRADNRLENLELWSTSQPAGQRVEDKVEWAQMILTRYGHLESSPTI